MGKHATPDLQPQVEYIRTSSEAHNVLYLWPNDEQLA